ncbi:hypothetical protein [Pseudanabaena sp. ABRG5-3]|uniref:hypothetical protein n=1 Tax=Pseudanabaena sp. ABRG5-3 TaxID=685565 RepID=UPI000DC6DF57|nr:hypothetical protein [Pseudanabaena sp. ABRG5-3]BBC24723.1 hypothetical protein ABRG53_2466 [Pseudanabaena sp. ABRG5-3]
MRHSSTRSLLTLAAIITALIAVDAPVRSQPATTQKSTIQQIVNPNVTPTQSPVEVKISRPQTNELPLNNKKASFVRMFEDIAVSPNFTPKVLELRGISGGGVATQKKSGRKSTETGECIGFIDQEPDHRITLTKPFRYLKLQVKSSGDTILLVRGPGGSWCSDDTSDRNPEISGDWLEGTYEVWVGSYEENASFPYLLQVTEVP